MITIQLRGIPTQTIIGVYHHEHVAPQPLLWDVDLTLSSQPIEDDLGSTVDYATLVAGLIEAVARMRVELLETLLLEVAAWMQTKVTWKRLRLTVHKPQALPHLQDVAVTLELGDGSS